MTGEGAEAALARVDRPVFALDADWRVTYANGAARELLADGRTLAGRVFWDAVPGVTDTDVPETFHAAVADGERRRAAVALADDRRVQFRAFPGEDDGLTVVVEDVTDRYRGVRRYEAVFEASVDPVCVIDGGGHFEDVNEAAVEMTGYDRERLLGAPADLVFENFYRLRRRVETRPEEADAAEPVPDDADEVEVTIETAAGTRRLCSVGVGPLAEGFVVVIRDVTDRRSREQRVAVLDRVLRHNIRNEMNVVIGRAEAASREASPEVADHVDRILDTARDLVHVSRNVRRFADAIDPDAGSVRSRDAVDLVQYAVEQFEKRHPDVEPRVVVREPVEVQAYQSVRAAVEELIENAVVHSGREDPTVTVTVDGDDGFGTVEVADDGPGLPDTERQVLTEGGETQLTHASGVGLWLVNWAVTKSGGHLSFEPNEPSGSVITIRLPRGTAERTAAPETTDGASPVDD